MQHVEVHSGGLPITLSGAGYLPLKRVLDVLVTALLLLLFAPIMALIAAGIKLHSPGPILFCQGRVGLHGKEFVCYKFRSMHQGASPSLHQAHIARLIEQNAGEAELRAGRSLKLERDPRVTGVGRLLRNTSLDELPQLWNVLRGEMSLVGPRPPIPYELEHYQEWHKRRFEALPGITGLWQVKGRNHVSFDEMVQMDIHYLEKMSLWLDLKIILQTPFAMLFGKGAG